MSEQFLTPNPSNDPFASTTTCTKFPNFRQNSLVAVVNVSEASCLFTVYTAPDLKYLVSAEQKLKTESPKPGWYEQDAEQIIEAVYKCTYQGCRLLPSHGYMRSDIEALGVTNQRETLVVWDEDTGKSLYRAILPNDIRAKDLTENLLTKQFNNDINYFKLISGLPVLACFPALKILWLKENVPAVMMAMQNGSCKVGTLETWIIWKLTRGMLHVTDVTNASRTLLMNISTLDWDEQLLSAFSIQPCILPKIRSCAEDFGTVTTELCVLKGIRIAGIIADQPATMLGQMCMRKGQTVANFNGGLNLLYNTGKRRVQSKELLTVVAYKLGEKEPCVYALEGNVPYCGNTLNWLQHNVRIVPNLQDVEVYANTGDSSGEIFFVPAFTGLHAPYWRKDARGILIGITSQTTRAHIVKAALEAICFQACDILEAIKLSGEYCQNVIYAGGEHANTALLMQMLADISGATVVYYGDDDLVSYGAAIAAGSAVNAVNLQRFEQGIWRLSIDFETYVPLKRNEKRIEHYLKWRRAVARSLNWLPKSKQVGLAEKKKNYLLFGSVFLGVIIAATLCIFKYTNVCARISR